MGWQQGPPVAERAHHHVAGVDAHAHLQRDGVVRAILDIELVERGPHRLGGSNRP